MKIWKYNRCGSCRKAIKYLDEKGINYSAEEILDSPPSKDELYSMLNFLDGNIKKLFNTSGVKYREGNYKEKIKDMDTDEMITILSENGALIKRPFILSDDYGTVGFKEDILDSIIK